MADLFGQEENKKIEPYKFEVKSNKGNKIDITYMPLAEMTPEQKTGLGDKIKEVVDLIENKELSPNA